MGRRSATASVRVMLEPVKVAGLPSWTVWLIGWVVMVAGPDAAETVLSQANRAVVSRARRDSLQDWFFINLRKSD